MTDFGGTYETGTVTLTNGSVNVSFTGTMMTTQAVQGDHIFCAGLIALVDVVVDDDSITLKHPWSGATQTNVVYVLNKVSAQRYDPALTQAKAREFLAFFENIGTFYFVDGAEPDPGLGSNGQFALKVNSGPWQIWYRTAGVWILQGSPVGITPRGLWSSAVLDYLVGDFVSWQGALWSSLQVPNVNRQPDLFPLYWRKELSGGDRYDIPSFDTDRPASGEKVVKLFPTGVSFNVGLGDSYAEADVAATASAVYSIRKNGVEFATITFGAGQTLGVIACPTLTVFTAGQDYEMIAPNPRDATLSGVTIHIIGYR